MAKTVLGKVGQQITDPLIPFSSIGGTFDTTPALIEKDPLIPVSQIRKGVTEFGKAFIAMPEKQVELLKQKEVSLPVMAGAALGLDIGAGRVYKGVSKTKQAITYSLAQRDAVANTIKQALPKIQNMVNQGKATIEEWGQLLKIGEKIEKGIDKATDLTNATELLKLKGFDVNVSIKKTIEEGKEAISAIKAKAFQWKERGFVTSVKQELPELKVAGQYVPRSTDRLAIRAKNLIKQDLATAEKMALTGTDDNAIAVGAELLKHYSDEAEKMTNVAVKNAIYDKAADLANTMARKLTEQGRSIQAASILARLTPEGQVRFAAREIQKYNEIMEQSRGGLGVLKRRIPELTGEQANYITNEMKSIQQMADGTEKSMRFQKLQNYISDLIPSPLYKKIIGVWKAGLLTGIKTSGLNILSNLNHFASEIIKDVPATVVDKVASLFTGERTVALTTKGIGRGVKEGFEKGWQYLRTGFDERGIGIKLDYKRVNFGQNKVAKSLQKYEETIFRLMGSEDQPFYYGAKGRSLYSQAIAQAKNKGLKGSEAAKFVDNLIQNPTDQMLKYAVLDAETAVFQQQTALGIAAKGIQRIPGGEIVVPFGRTPSAVATQVLNYSPVGIVKTIAENIGKGRFDQRLFSQGLGRGLTGTAILYLGAELFKKGLISLNRPTTEREQKLWELEGRKENSIKIGNAWRSIQVLGPAGNVLLIGGHFQNEFNNSGSPTEAIAKAASGSAKSFTEQTFLKGMSQTIDALTDPARSAEGYMGSTLASTIPTIVSDVARAIDNQERRTENILQRFQTRIPGWREQLEPQITVFGEEKERIGNFLEVMADPSRPSKEIISPTVSELRRLWDAGYKVSPTLLGDKKGYKILTPQQNTNLWKRAGEITKQKITNLMAAEEYNKLADDKRAKKIEEFAEKSKLIARVEKVIELTTNLTGDELKAKLSALKKDDLMTREVYEKYLELR